ncbi:hypothetical protein BDR05DRAFT_965246 [Suillus weaverae]|nr:hypothetical protein BDR05DRAFT_965246 [Suillus weaverae]
MPTVLPTQLACPPASFHACLPISLSAYSNVLGTVATSEQLSVHSDFYTPLGGAEEPAVAQTLARTLAQTLAQTLSHTGHFRDALSFVFSEIQRVDVVYPELNSTRSGGDKQLVSSREGNARSPSRMLCNSLSMRGFVAISVALHSGPMCRVLTVMTMVQMMAPPSTPKRPLNPLVPSNI